MADHLVEGVVPADILADRQDVTVRGAERGGMNRTGLLIQRLAGRKGGKRREQGPSSNFGRGGDGRQLRQRFLDGGQSAYAAARLAGNGATALGQALGMLLFQPHIDPNASRSLTHINT